MQKMNDQRQRELARIHIAKKELGLDDTTYRDMLWTVARVRSAKDLDSEGRRKVLAHLKTRGFKSKKKTNQYPDAPHNLANVPQLQKIEALLADMKLPWRYAHSIANRMFKIKRVDWLRQPQQRDAIIAALHTEQKKRSMKTRINNLLNELGYASDYADKLAARVLTEPDGWHRHLVKLEIIYDCLIMEREHAQ